MHLSVNSCLFFSIMFVFQHISIWLIFPVNWRHDSLPSYRDFLSALRAGVVLWLDCFRDMFVLLHQLDHVFSAYDSADCIYCASVDNLWPCESCVMSRYEVALQRSGWRYRSLLTKWGECGEENLPSWNDTKKSGEEPDSEKELVLILVILNCLRT